jgi:glycosyltransferase involved in cell wall biosynthesis
VCRIEPENNIHVILEALSKTQMPLIMVGNWNNSSYGIELREKYSGFQNLSLLDPIYDSQKLNVLRSNCEVYIHGHSAGGTNPSLVEAMYLKLPILAFDVSYNRETTENKCLYFSCESELKNCIESLTPEINLKVADQMKEIANRRYTWNQVAKKYNQLIYGFDFNYQRCSVIPKISMLSLSELQELNLRHIKMSSKLN